MSNPVLSLKTRSRATCSSKCSHGSSTSKVIAIARAEAEAVKAQLEYAEKEAEIKVEKARLEASLDLLNLKKLAAAAKAKADTLEAALEDVDILSQKLSQIDVEPHNPMQHTQEYIQKHCKQLHRSASMPSLKAQLSQDHTDASPMLQQKVYLPMQTPQQQINTKQKSPITAGGHRHTHTVSQPVHQPPWLPRSSESAGKIEPPDHPCYQDCDIDSHNYPPASQSCMANQVGPADGWNSPHAAYPGMLYPASMQQTQPAHRHEMSDLVRFMARREIITTGLLQFDDKPENYRAWRASFSNTVTDLNLTEKEEIDLLVKWLGHESAEHVKRIRAVHVNNSRKGLQMAWQRLNECFGASEVIEESLWRRVDSFGKLSNSDHQRLRELGDLLMELQAAKEEGEFPGLAYLDTARGISSIVQKLPFALQERWMTQGSRYKDVHNVLFPPFSFFTSFICQQAKMRNDPGFIIAPHASDVHKAERQYPKNAAYRTPVAVHKTEISPATTSPTDATRSKNWDHSKLCPIHNKPHPLHKCRSFREKPLEERKAFLKQNNICYRCCMSTSHLARNCDKAGMCTECDSDRHVSALHPGPAPWFVKAPATAEEHGGEQDDNSAQTVVAAKCTEVCGKHLSDRSCAKICLVRVYPTGQREKAITLYAILDDQSNRSLVRSEFFERFGSRGCNSPYSLKTCAGVINTTGRRAHGFQVESLDGQVSIPLPTLIECNEIPDDRTEIPTPEVALHYKHLNALMSQIPKLDPNAPILMLLGRDIIRIHKVRDQINGPHDSPYAQRLDLGWVIVGNVCLGGVHKPDVVHTLYTNTLDSGHMSLFKPCPNYHAVKEQYNMVAPTLLQTSLLTERATCKDPGDHNVHTVLERTNFIGACHDLEIPSNLRDTKMETFLSEQGCFWIFNPPHSSHMGGAWERMIGVTKKILDSTLSQSESSRLTHEVLTTLMAEVTAIVNSRPLTTVSTDPEDPQILTPATLLTQKFGSSPLPPNELDCKNLYKRQWRQVQSLASTFWDRWRKQYLSTLQVRKKWQSDKPNILPGAVVLMRDLQVKRNQWPMGRVTKASQKRSLAKTEKSARWR